MGERRVAGWSEQGPPTTGFYTVGDFIYDTDGTLWKCTAAGTPGTWAETQSGAYDAVPGAWTAVTFTNSWVNFGSNYVEARYRRHGDDVEVEFAIKSGTSGTSAFTLPVGFRPAKRIFAPASADGTAMANVVFELDGTVLPTNTTGANVNGFCMLPRITLTAA